MTTQADTTAPAQSSTAPAAPTGASIVEAFAASQGIRTLDGGAAAAQQAQANAAQAPGNAAAAAAQLAAEPPAAAQPAATEKPPENPLDRLARKDAQYQQERNRARALEQERDQLRQQHEAFIQRLTTDPMAVLRERNVRFGDLATAALMGADGKPAKQGAQAAAPSPEVAALQAKLAELEEFVNGRKQLDQQTQRQQQEAQQVGLVRDYLGKKADDFPLINDGGHHAQVLKLVEAHVGQHGGFADDREAAETLEFYARQVEQEHQNQLDALLAKPGYKSLLAKKLGVQAPAPQTLATPARQEIQGVSAVRNPAAALTNDLASQVTTPAGQKPETQEERMARTSAEMQRIYDAHRASAV